MNRDLFTPGTGLPGHSVTFTDNNLYFPSNVCLFSGVFKGPTSKRLDKPNGEILTVIKIVNDQYVSVIVEFGLCVTSVLMSKLGCQEIILDLTGVGCQFFSSSSSVDDFSHYFCTTNNKRSSKIRKEGGPNVLLMFQVVLQHLTSPEESLCNKKKRVY